MKAILLASLMITTTWAADPPLVRTKTAAAPMPDPTQQLKELQKLLGGAAPAVAAAVPDGWQMPVGPLSPSANEAIVISDAWHGGNSRPMAGRDGRVIFQYGAGLPEVVCAPMRICIIELQPGEKVTGEPKIGDPRWDVSPQVFGTGATETALVVVKPLSPDLDTNFLITTDRRAYFLRLVTSKDGRYVSRVAFEYPEQHAAEWKKVIEAGQQAHEAEKGFLVAKGPKNDKYNIKASKKAEAIKPTIVWDQDGQTHITMNPRVHDGEAPILMVEGADGKMGQVNYRALPGDVYLVDRVFERAELILGTGKKQARVEIVKQKGA